MYNSGPGTLLTNSATANLNTYTFSITGTSAVYYKFKVAGVNNVGIGAYSTEVTYAAVSQPGIPTALTIANSTLTSITVSW